MIDTLLSIIKNDYQKHVVDESLNRIIKCLSILSEEEIWRAANSNTNSIGSIVVHLQGNVKQYISSGIGGEPDTRIRQKEFGIMPSIIKEELLKQLSDVVLESNRVVQNIKAEELNHVKRVQCFEKSVLSIIIHVIEHFSYHTGQITYFTKMTKDIDTGYYSGLDLDQLNSE